MKLTLFPSRPFRGNTQVYARIAAEPIVRGKQWNMRSQACKGIGDGEHKHQTTDSDRESQQNRASVPKEISIISPSAKERSYHSINTRSDPASIHRLDEVVCVPDDKRSQWHEQEHCESSPPFETCQP